MVNHNSKKPLSPIAIEGLPLKIKTVKTLEEYLQSAPRKFLEPIKPVESATTVKAVKKPIFEVRGQKATLLDRPVALPPLNLPKVEDEASSKAATAAFLSRKVILPPIIPAVEASKDQDEYSDDEDEYMYGYKEEVANQSEGLSLEQLVEKISSCDGAHSDKESEEVAKIIQDWFEWQECEKDIKDWNPKIDLEKPFEQTSSLAVKFGDMKHAFKVFMVEFVNMQFGITHSTEAKLGYLSALPINITSDSKIAQIKEDLLTADFPLNSVIKNQDVERVKYTSDFGYASEPDPKNAIKFPQRNTAPAVGSKLKMEGRVLERQVLMEEELSSQIIEHLDMTAVSFDELAKICESYYKEHGDVDIEIIDVWLSNPFNASYFVDLPTEELMNRNAPIWEKFGNSSEYARHELISKYIEYNSEYIGADQLADILAADVDFSPKQRRSIVDEWISFSSAQRVSDLLEDEELLKKFGDQAKYVERKSEDFIDTNKTTNSLSRRISIDRVKSTETEEYHNR